MERFDVAIIGAGAAGCMAAVKSAEKGRRVLLLEKNRQIGSKILLTGNKRGNITNLADKDTAIGNYRNGKFLTNAFARFFNTELCDFFESRGLQLKVERGQRVYPASDKAEDIVKTFQKILHGLPVRQYFRQEVTGISRAEDVFEIAAGKTFFYADRTIIACGGMSFPGTGSTGDGYRWASAFGHSIVEPLPALCGIETGSVYNDWIGVTLKNVSVKAYAGNREVAADFGEMIFTHYGISGPAVLNISGDVAESMPEDRVRIKINLKPALSPEKLDARLQREFQKSPRRMIKSVMPALLPQAMSGRILRLAAIEPDKVAGEIGKKERGRLVEVLSGISFSVKKMRPFTDSMVTRGGVSVKEINPVTMESRIARGLFLAGEVIDIDGRTGGYNLQAAFTTGYIAGSNA